MKKILIILTALIVLSGCDIDANQAYGRCANQCTLHEQCMGESYMLGCLQECTKILQDYYSCKN